MNEARISDDLVLVNDKGLYCPLGDFYIDPWRPVENALITHAHSDHARTWAQYYFSSAKALPFVKHRLGKELKIEGFEYGRKVKLGQTWVSFHPAGHIAGSAQIRIEHRDRVWTVSGDHIRWSLVIGNHELGSRPYLASLPFEIFEESLDVGPLTLAHGHRRNESRFVIVGHVHPAISLRTGTTRLRLPCFVLDEKRLLLPSFGSLTGGFELDVTSDQRIFAITPQEVFEVKGH